MHYEPSSHVHCCESHTLHCEQFSVQQLNLIRVVKAHIYCITEQKKATVKVSCKKMCIIIKMSYKYLK